jgi:archaeal flagellar protein FlaJ
MPSTNRYQKLWESLLLYNGIEMDSRRFSAYVLIGSVVPGIAVAALFSSDLLVGTLAGLAAIVAIHVVVYSYLLLGANSRAAKVEEVLPDFLSLVASNVRAGLTPDKALIVSAREEFGPLTAAINKAGKHSITGMPMEQVIMGMGEHIQSNTLEKTIRLIVEGLHSGGDMAELLEKTALDVRKFRAVKREVNSIILNYVLFIVAAITFGAPLLYGVSTFLVDIMLAIKSKIGGDTTAIQAMSGSVGIFKGQLMLTPDGVVMFASAAIVITVFFGCMAVGIMSSGRRMDGLKYFPLLAAIGLILLFGIRFLLTTLLGGMLAGPSG